MNGLINSLKKNRGITLMELMVAVLIIILIATIAMVALKNSRAKARDAKRVYDIQQYAKALQLYNQENNGVYPAESGLLGKGHDDSVNTELRKYLASLPIDPLDNGSDAPTHKDYYYYYELKNDCKGDGQHIPTLHIQNIETSNPDYNYNPCSEGSGGQYSDRADYLIIVR